MFLSKVPPSCSLGYILNIGKIVLGTSLILHLNCFEPTFECLITAFFLPLVFTQQIHKYVH